MRAVLVSLYGAFLITGLTLSSQAATARPTPANNNPATAATQTQTQAQTQARTDAQTPMRPDADDITTRDLASLDQFLDDHKNIEKELNANPSLVNDSKYLDHHKDLRDFLNARPQLRQALQQDPRYFMRREDRFDAREDARRMPPPQGAQQTGTQTGNQTGNQQTGSRQNPTSVSQANGEGTANNPSAGNRPGDQDRRNRNPDVTRGELANFDQYLDSHPEIDRQLAANPHLLDDQNYLQANPSLQSYLTDHPRVREEITETPDYFMRREERFDARQDQRFNGNPGVAQGQPNRGQDQDEDRRREQSAKIDQYLADHKDVDNDLRRNPSLINDEKYLKRHHDLDEFLRANPDVRVVIVSNPNYFTDRDRVAMRMGYQGPNGEGSVNGAPGNPQLTPDQRQRMDQFMDKHQKIAKDLHNNPSLVGDEKYVSHHKDLREFFDHNPGVRDCLAQDQQHAYFAERARRMKQPMTKASTNPRPDQPNQTTQPSQNNQQQNPQPKAPVDQRQNMGPTTAH